MRALQLTFLWELNLFVNVGEGGEGDVSDFVGGYFVTYQPTG